MMKRVIIVTVVFLFGVNSLFAQSKYEVPPKAFFGKWVVEKSLYYPPEGEQAKEIKEEVPDQEYLFKKGKKQALYRYFSDRKKSEYGITILEVSRRRLVFRSWSSHPSNKTVLTLKEDGTAVVNKIYAKGEEVFYLRRPKEDSIVAESKKEAD